MVELAGAGDGRRDKMSHPQSMKVCEVISGRCVSLREMLFVDWGSVSGGTWRERLRELAVILGPFL